MTNEEKAQELKAKTARENGAKSKGPLTPEGKEQSKRNAIKHGERAESLKLLVPPHSACLLHDERLAFYNLFDRNIAKYSTSDEHEKEIVREITCLQWSNGRTRLALTSMFNREIIRTGAQLQPLDELTFNVENVAAAYEGLADNRTIQNFHKEYALNLRLIIALERRLVHIQKHWPGKSDKTQNSNDERQTFGIADPPTEGTQPPPPQPVENTESTSKKRKKVVNVTGPLTPAKIQLYQRIFPNRDLEFNVFQPEPEPKAA